MFIAQPPGYEIRENAYCKPIIGSAETLNNAIKACPSCMIFTGRVGGFFTCDADAEIMWSNGSRLYIKSK